jgi:hypothetical protein
VEPMPKALVSTQEPSRRVARFRFAQEVAQSPGKGSRWNRRNRCSNTSRLTSGTDTEPRRSYPRTRLGLDEGHPPLGLRGCAGWARSKRSSNGARSKRRMIACISSAADYLD